MSINKLAPSPQEAAKAKPFRCRAGSVWAPASLWHPELLHERAARLLREWDAFMARRDYGEARRLVLEWSEMDVDLFLEALGRRLQANEAAGKA